jgi:hypothetical protein
MAGNAHDAQSTEATKSQASIPTAAEEDGPRAEADAVRRGY